MGLYSRSRGYRDYQPGGKKRKYIKRFFIFVFLFFISFNFISYFLLTSFRTVSQAMVPVLPEESIFLSTPVFYGNEIKIFNIKFSGFRVPKRGELVMVRPSYILEDPFFKCLLDAAVRFFTLQKVSILSSVNNNWENYILPKRIIGIPGDEITVRQNQVFIRPAGEASFFPETKLLKTDVVIQNSSLPENWETDLPFSGDLSAMTLKDDEYFLLSDNRGYGSDGMIWGISKKGEIKQKVFLRVWPKPSFHL